MDKQVSVSRFLTLPNITAVLFIGLNLIGILHHELWADEMHHWLLARDSNSFTELLHNSRFEGHPIIWDGLLFIITRFTTNPVWMQVLNVIISSLTVFLILKYAPFPITVRILLVFGYFLFYEYAEISRNYSIGVLLIVSCCILFEKRNDRYILIALLLGLLANTHFFAAIISFAFFIVLSADYFSESVPKKRLLIGSIIYFAILITAILQVIQTGGIVPNSPPPTSAFHQLGASISILTKGFLPLPDVRTINWWNTNWLVNLSPILNGILSFVILIISFVILKNKPKILFLFFFSFLNIALFIFVLHIYAIRYYGFVFIVFIAALWIGDIFNSESKNKVFKPFIYTILIVQLIAGVIAFTLDFTKPFSQGKNTAAYLQLSELSNHIIAVSGCNAGPPISGYLNKKVFYPQINQWGSFCLWNLPFEEVNNDSALQNVKRLCINSDSSIVLLLNNPLSNHLQNDSTVQVHFVKDFTESTVASENYFIYLVTPQK